MVNPPSTALRRRSKELQLAAARELLSDEDSAALLMFYAAECGLKAAYMRVNNLKATDDTRGGARAARDFGHRIDQLMGALRIPTSVVGAAPAPVLRRGGNALQFFYLHEAWRYGEKVDDTRQIYTWLSNVAVWVETNR